MKSLEELLKNEDEITGTGRSGNIGIEKIIKCPKCGKEQVVPSYETDIICIGCSGNVTTDFNLDKLTDNTWNFQTENTKVKKRKDTTFNAVTHLPTRKHTVEDKT